MGRIARSWTLMKATMGFLKRNPKLAIFPVLSGVLSIFLVVAIGGGALAGLAAAGMFREGVGRGVAAAAVPVLAVVYVMCAFVVIVFNAALIGCVLLDLEGKPCAWRDGMRLAWARRWVILRWSLLYAGVGIFLNILENQANRLPFGGRLLARGVLWFTGAAWTLVTFLLVPVLVYEEVNLREGIRRSVALFKRTWGEQVVGRIGLSLIALIVAILAVTILALAICIQVKFNPASAAGLISLWGTAGVLVLMIVLGAGILGTVLNGIYTAVLYSYAVTGMLPKEFPAELAPARKEGGVMDIRVDADSGVPLYQQVAHQIRLAVLGGGLKSGERLPSVRELSERLKINPLTVGRAYAELERMKLTVSRWGSGNFVAEMVPAGVEEAGNRVLETLVDRFVREALPLAGDKRKLVRLVEDRTRREPV